MYFKAYLLRKVQIIPRATAKDLVKMLEETGIKVSTSTVKLVLYRHNLKETAIKKPDCSLQLHMGTKIVIIKSNVFI